MLILHLIRKATWYDAKRLCADIMCPIPDTVRIIRYNQAGVCCRANVGRGVNRISGIDGEIGWITSTSAKMVRILRIYPISQDWGYVRQFVMALIEYNCVDLIIG